MKLLRPWLLLAVLAMGCATSKPGEYVLWFHEEINSQTPAKWRRDVVIPVSHLELSIDPRPVLTEKRIVSAEIIQNSGGPAVLVKFDPHGLVLLDEFTTRQRGKYMVVMMNDQPLVAWLVDRRLSLGQFLIEPALTDKQVQDLVDSLTRTAKKYHGGHPLLQSPW